MNDEGWLGGGSWEYLFPMLSNKNIKASKHQSIKKKVKMNE